VSPPSLRLCGGGSELPRREYPVEPLEAQTRAGMPQIMEPQLGPFGSRDRPAATPTAG
jgi:hypothetical protein